MRLRLGLASVWDLAYRHGRTDLPYLAAMYTPCSSYVSSIHMISLMNSGSVSMAIFYFA